MLEQLKKETDLARLVASYGISLKRAGKDLVGRCPFHKDDTPSFVVTPGKNLWHCFGCGAGGDAIEFLMQKEGLDFPAAVERLQRFTGNASNAGDADASHPSNPADNVPASLTGAMAADLLTSVVEHYHKTLKNDSGALRYLESRGLASAEAGAEAIVRFGVGYADGSLSGILPTPQSKEGELIRGLLKKMGLMRSGTGHEHFEGCITFPVFDERGVLCGMYGRRLSNKHRVKHLYLPGPHRGIWNRDAYNQPDLILCESIIDAMSFYVHGLRNVSCAYGIEGFTDEMMQALRTGNVKRLYIAFDADRPGNDASIRLAKRLAAELPGLECLRILLPMGLDANDYILRLMDPAGGLRELVAIARPVLESPDLAKTPVLPVHIEEIPAKMVRKAPPEPECTVNGDEVRLAYGERRYRVRGLYKNTTDHLMKINLRVSLGDVYHVDTFDLLSAKSRLSFIEQAAGELAVDHEILKHDLGRILSTLEELQEKRLRETLRPEQDVVEIPEDRRKKAIAYLKDPALVRNIVADFERCGLVGERINSLIGYLGTVSRKTEAPLAIIIQSSSSAGKSTLMDALLAFVPEEDRIKFSMMTGQSLYYMQSRSLKHRILAIAEEEGVERAKYAIKILQSEGRITIATTIRDPATGLPDTKEFEVEGPVMILLTTTNTEIDEELLNRCLVITINEDREQTRRIQSLQRHRRTAAGLTAGRHDAVHLRELHADAQRLLRTLPVVIPDVELLDFPDTQLRMRRDHEKFLTLIETVAFLHQYQREIRKEGDMEYIVATEEDVALAAFLAGEVFGISLDDLAPQTKRLLTLIEELVTEGAARHSVEKRMFRFTRRDVREYTNWGDSRLKKHIARLEDLEYLLVHGGGRGQFIEYELAYNGEGDDGSPFVPGLTAGRYAPLGEELVNFLKEKSRFFDEKSRQNEQKSPPSHPQVTAKSPLSHGPKSAEKALNQGTFAEKREKRLEKGIGGSFANPRTPPQSHAREAGL
ncbi:CHC2 zinc finger domain-containing protein [Leptonema illini]|uniref:CHC2 zinc finger domain-containing protein n=1 Tax=Leptonema illini TaxID=183 RepID=UPI00145D2FB9|nr:CHC2 zinc finger domain-containing protein [Leptonema illini]